MQIEWTVTADVDLDEIVTYISEDNRAIGSEVMEKIIERVEKLFEFPEQGRIVPELYDLGIVECRELIVPPWRIIYKITNKTILIIAVFDGRRNLKDVLFDRFGFFHV